MFTWCRIAVGHSCACFPSHTSAPALRGPLMPPELPEMKILSKSWLFMALSAAAPVPGIGDMVDWVRWPQFFSPLHIHTVYHVALKFFLPSSDLGFGHVTCFAQWDVRRGDVTRGLNCAWPVGFLSSPWQKHAQEPHWSKGEERLWTELSPTCSFESSLAPPGSVACSWPAAVWAVVDNPTEVWGYLLHSIFVAIGYYVEVSFWKLIMPTFLSFTFLLNIGHHGICRKLRISIYQSFAIAWCHFWLKMYKLCGKRKMLTCIFQFPGKKLGEGRKPLLLRFLVFHFHLPSTYQL